MCTEVYTDLHISMVTAITNVTVSVQYFFHVKAQIKCKHRLVVSTGARSKSTLDAHKIMAHKQVFSFVLPPEPFC